MVTSLPPATILDTETRSFPSSIMGGSYQVSTWFPPGYPEPDRKYPVIYLLEGDYLMGIVSGSEFYVRTSENKVRDLGQIAR